MLQTDFGIPVRETTRDKEIYGQTCPRPLASRPALCDTRPKRAQQKEAPSGNIGTAQEADSERPGCQAIQAIILDGAGALFDRCWGTASSLASHFAHDRTKSRGPDSAVAFRLPSVGPFNPFHGRAQ